MNRDSKYTKAWSEIDSLEKKGLLRSALDKTILLYGVAARDGDAPQLLKTIVYKGKFLQLLEEEGEVAAIHMVQDELNSAVFPNRQILFSLIGELYHNYLMAHRWQIQSRTTVDKTQTSGDIRTWTAADFEEAAAAAYLASVQHEGLKQVLLKQYEAVLLTEKPDPGYWNSLMDLLTFRALSHFSKSSSFLTSPVYRFYLDQPEAFSGTAEFTAFAFPGRDSAAHEYRALNLYQIWLSQKLDEGNIPALVDADLMRLEFVYDKSVHPQKDSLYTAALQKLEQQFPKEAGVAEAIYRRARMLYISGNKYANAREEEYRLDKQRARILAEEAIRRFPGSYGATLCARLIDQINASSLQVEVEQVVLPNKPILASVAFTNNRKVWFRLVRLSEKQMEQLDEMDRVEALKLLSGISSLRNWQANLPDDGDHQEHRTELRLEPLPLGQYALIFDDSLLSASGKIATGTASWIRFAVSEMAYFTTQKEGETELLLVHRDHGAPLSGVEVILFSVSYDYRNNRQKRTEVRRDKTDANGLVRFKLPQSNYMVRFARGEDVLHGGSFSNYWWDRQETDEVHTHFFLDRGIYRPGQTVYYKGIVTESRSGSGNVRILANKKAVVTFRNANNQEVSRQEVVTNAYGSFHGSFTTPVGGLRGRMYLHSSLGESLTAFLVEEYKRPRFEVKIAPLEGQPALGEEVAVVGEARMFAGSAADGAKVVYRVTRSASFPWWMWWKPLPSSEETLIASGETITDATGQFIVRFPALADPAIDPAGLPEFQFRIEADVIDITGETHTASRTVRLGFTNLRASLGIGAWMDIAKSNQIGIQTKNLDDQPVSATGKIRFLEVKGPGKPLLERFWEAPDRPVIPEEVFRRDFPFLPYGREADPMTWPVKSPVWESDFNTGSQPYVELPAGRFPAGYYLVELETRDINGKLLSLRKLVRVTDSAKRSIPAGELCYIELSAETAEPGDQVIAHIATGFGPIHCFLDKGSRGKVAGSRWLYFSDWLTDSTTIEEEDRGNRFYMLNFVRYNRAFSFSRMLTVPWTNKQLNITYETFRDKLMPGQEEEWRLRIAGPDGDAVAAEVLAAMYDASLDQFQPNSWNFNLFPYFGMPYGHRTVHGFESIAQRLSRSGEGANPLPWRYPAFNWFGLSDISYLGEAYSPNSGINKMMRLDMRAMSEAMPAAEPMAAMRPVEKAIPPNGPAPANQETEDSGEKPSLPVPRSNLRETVFFYPRMLTDKDGALVLKFTMNEALTRWKLMTLAHTTEVQSAIDVRELVTRKDLMVLPNLPRFLREGDEIELSARVTNLSGGVLKGNARLELFDALTMQPLDAVYGNTQSTVYFFAEDAQSAPVFWKIRVPEGGTGALLIRISASSGNFSDAEENAVPVLINRMQVTESLPLFVRGGSKKVFTLESLKHSGESPTLSPLRLSVEMTSSPVWLAVKALPYLIEYPYDCAEQVFSRFYANAIAGSIVRSTPKLEAIFRRWRDSGSLTSRLTQNQELKSLLLEETPWVMEAQEEEIQQKNIALLFDLNTMAQGQAVALDRLRDMQLPNGAWPWFPNGPENRFITQHILAGLGKLQHLELLPASGREMLNNGLGFLEEQVKTDFAALMEQIRLGNAKAEDNHLDPLLIHYLYTRSTAGNPEISPDFQSIFDYYIGQSRSFWNTFGVMEQGMIALVLFRLGDRETPAAILASLKERAQYSEELGMYWKIPRGYFWNQLPVETQSLLIEVFAETGNHAREVEEMKIWLLKHKQTNRWPSTKATADAVYALLKTRGSEEWPGDDQLVNLSFPKAHNKKEISDNLLSARTSAEPGTGYYKTSWEGDKIKPGMATVELQNPNKGVAWGGMYWQYFEQIDKVQSFAETPLKLNRQFFKAVTGDRGTILEAIRDGESLQPGDKVVVRLGLTVDRQMEFVHIKDMRASGLEPVNPLSAYRWQDGLGYYESPGDLATNFFIDYLPRGTYVFEYSLRVNHGGNFSSGITSIQCMYAPEFSSHSAGSRLQISR